MTIESLKENISEYIEDIYPYWHIAIEPGLISMDDILNQIIFESIKIAYEDKMETERKSIRQFLKEYGMDTDSFRRSFSREMAYVQYYRDHEQVMRMKEQGVFYPELEGKDMKDITNRMEGHEITPMNFLEIKNIHDVRILKKVVGRQTQSTKNISNDKFIELYDEYDELIESYKTKMIDSESMVFYTLALFTLEWKYGLEWTYRVAKLLEGHKNFFDYLMRVALFSAEINVPEIPGKMPGASGTNRMHMIRQNYLSVITELDEEQWENKCVSYGVAYSIFSHIKLNEDYRVAKLLKKISIDEWARFIEENYWIWDNVTVKKEWTNKSIKIARDFQKVIFMNTPEPKIK